MNLRSVLVAGAAMAALASAGAASADAKPVHHHKKAPVPSQETVELKAEVDALKAQVQALEGRLDSQAQAQQQTAAAAQAAASQAQAATAAAQAAQTQVAADDSKILTIPAQVATAAKANAPKPGWWNDTKVGATMFADASNIQNKNAAGKTAQSGTDYDIKRLYLVVDHKINDIYSFNVTTDFTYDTNSGAGANTASGVKATQLYLKKAYVQAKYADGFIVRLGAADLPWVPFDEGIYGYRYVEQTLIDRTKFGTSADWGVHILGSFANNLLSYQVSVIDGEGYKQPAIGTANRTNSVDVEGRVSANYKHFTLAVGGYDGKLGNNVSGIQTYNTAERVDALAAYTDKKIRLGFEYFWAQDWKDVLQSNPAKVNKSDGYEIFASYNVTSKIALFGRYDRVRPLISTTPGENDNYFNVGLSYKPVGPLDFAIVYKRENVNNGSFSTAEGVIGIPSGATTGQGTYDEIGLFTQVKF